MYSKIDKKSLPCICVPSLFCPPAAYGGESFIAVDLCKSKGRNPLKEIFGTEFFRIRDQKLLFIDYCRC